MSILETAQDIIHGARAKDYGPPELNHGCTASMFSAFIQRKYGVSLGFTPEDVCVFNILQKVSRLATSPGHIDSLVDIGGYAGNYEMVLEAK